MTWPRLLAAVAALLLAACAPGGSGNVIDSERNVSAFNQLRVDGAVEVVVAIGEAQGMLTIRADDNLLERITTTVEGGVLTIESGSMSPSTLPRIEVATTGLADVTASGASRVTVTDLDGGVIDVVVSDNARAALEGTVGRLTVDASDASDVEAFELEADEAEITASDNADVEVTVNARLTVDADDNAQVTYGGEPDDRQVDVTGTATVNEG